MNQRLIRVNDMIKFMGKDNYYEFIEYLKKEKNIPDKVPIWIIAEWS